MQLLRHKYYILLKKKNENRCNFRQNPGFAEATNGPGNWLTVSVRNPFTIPTAHLNAGSFFSPSSSSLVQSVEQKN